MSGNHPQLARYLRELLDVDSQGGRPLQSRAAGRLMSVLESDPAGVVELYHLAGRFGVDPQRLYPEFVLGITGAPGSGKSTLVDALIREYRRRLPELSIGVIAVDPSSPFVGGAVLGDRVRMMDHATDPGVFVRSLASRGHLGGLALGVKGVMHVMALAGCAIVIVETVGVGQSEVQVAQVADLVTVVLAPGQGDSIQLLKAGLMEVGDIFVVNKADREQAATLYSQLLATLTMIGRDAGLPGEAEPAQRQTPTIGGLSGDSLAELGMRASANAAVFLVSATGSTGVTALIDEVESRRAEHDDAWRRRRRNAMRDEVRQAILELAQKRSQRILAERFDVRQRVERVLSGELTTLDAAAFLLAGAADAALEEVSGRGDQQLERQGDDPRTRAAVREAKP